MSEAPSASVDTRRATARDLERLAALLQANGLSPLPSRIPLANVIVALAGPQTVGGAALEFHGRTGVLHAVVVAADRRRQGIGTSLLQGVIARCHEIGLRDLYVVAGGASAFFESVGFGPVDEADLPAELRRLREVRQREAGAPPVLRYPLATRW